MLERAFVASVCFTHAFHKRKHCGCLGRQSRRKRHCVLLIRKHYTVGHQVRAVDPALDVEAFF